MLRENFERRKAEIEQEINSMMERLSEMLDCVSQEMASSDPEHLEHALKAIRAMDRKVNNSEETIYHYCIQLISLEQPVASDLRFSIGVLKYIGDLERIGDHCVHMMRILYRNAKPDERLDVPKGLLDMVGRLRPMFERCMQAITELDTDLAREVIAEDESLDDVHKQFIKETARSIHSSPELSDSFVNFMFLSRFIERIGDHMVNTSEWLIFISEGTRPS